MTKKTIQFTSENLYSIKFSGHSLYMSLILKSYTNNDIVSRSLLLLYSVYVLVNNIFAPLCANLYSKLLLIVMRSFPLL